MNSKLSSTIIVLAISAVILLTLLSMAQPSIAATRNTVFQIDGNHVFQTTITNSTSTSTSTTGNRTGPLDFIIAPLAAVVRAAITPYLGSPPRTPFSTLFTIGIAILVSLISATTGKLLVDYEMVRKNMREFQAYQRDLNKARKANDEATLSKLMKKQQAMMKLQSRASMEQMKVTAVTFVPFILLWYVMSAVLGSVVVADAPWPVLQPFLGTHLVFWQWYLLSNFAISLPIYKVFGIGMTDN